MKITEVSRDHAYARRRGWLGPDGAFAAPGDATSLTTTETDTDLVLHPDGSGGVEWGADDTGVTVEDEGTPLATVATTLNFVGAGVTASGSGATKTITVTAGSAGTGAYTVETQNPQSERYLQQDGVFRNPLLLGTGTISVGSISTLTDDTKYNAWPDIKRMRNGQLIAVYTKGDSHHADNTGKAVCKIGTEALNGAVTWGSEITIYDDPSLWVTVMAVGVSHTGRVFATLFRDNAGAAGTGEAAVVYSDDYGVTWTTWSTLSTSFTSDAFGAGPVVELGNGDLLVTIEGRSSPTAVANRSSHTLRSTDNGASWGSEVTIRDYVTDTRPYYETCLVLLDNDNLLAVHRTSGGTGTHYISLSTDGGATWGTPYSAFDGYGAPHTIQLSTGTLIATTRRNSNASTILYTSTDRGVTWSALTSFDATMTEMEYAAVVELLDGRLLVIEGYQPSGATTNSDIKTGYVTETVTSLRDAGVTGFAVPAIAYGTPAAGSATTAIRSDATIAKPTAPDVDFSADVTNNNVTSGHHGLTPKSPADATQFLNGAATPAFAAVKDSDLSTSDITTNNVSTSKHGFAPKAPNDATQYLDGTGAYSVPAGTSGAGVDHAHVADERHLSDGSTTTYTLDEYFLDGSVWAMNITTLAWLGVTETAPDQVTVSAAGASGDTIQFTYAAAAA